jgi:hypothetical protein
MGLGVSGFSPERFLPQGKISFLLPQAFLRMGSRHSCQSCLLLHLSPFAILGSSAFSSPSDFHSSTLNFSNRLMNYATIILCVKRDIPRQEVIYE